MSQKSFLSILILSLFAPLLAQKSDASVFQTHEPLYDQDWLLTTIRGSVGFDAPLDWFLEIQPRVNTSYPEQNRVLIRPAVIWQVSDHSSLWAGYLNLLNQDSTTLEHRLWQQFQTQMRFNEGGIVLLSRTRLEQRCPAPCDLENLAHRLREMIRVQIPLGEESKWAIVLFDEFFINLNESSLQRSTGLEQNRIFVGGRYQFNPSLSLEMGYLRQTTGISTANRKDLNNILLWINIRI